MSDKIILMQDARDKKKVSIGNGSLYFELKNYFRWRKGDFKERFFKLGTSDHDDFIAYLIKNGYDES